MFVLLRSLFLICAIRFVIVVLLCYAVGYCYFVFVFLFGFFCFGRGNLLVILGRQLGPHPLPLFLEPPAAHDDSNPSSLARIPVEATMMPGLSETLMIPLICVLFR